MEILIASFVRGVSQVPEVNRFIMNKQFYNRKELTASFTLLMDTDDGSIEENTVKVFFDPTDTIYDVSARVKDMVQKNRRAETSGFALKLASAVLKVPLLPNLVVGLAAEQPVPQVLIKLNRHNRISSSCFIFQPDPGLSRRKYRRR